MKKEEGQGESEFRTSELKDSDFRFGSNLFASNTKILTFSACKGWRDLKEEYMIPIH